MKPHLDVVGCELNRETNTISFYLNGKNLGVAFEDVDDKVLLYPAVSVSRFGGCSFNFGRRSHSATTKRPFVHHEIFLEYSGSKKTGEELPVDVTVVPDSSSYPLGETCGPDFKYPPADCKSLWDAIPDPEDWIVKHWKLREHYNTFVPPPLGNFPRRSAQC